MPWAMDITVPDHSTHLHGLGVTGPPAGSEMSFGSDLSSTSGADSPRSPPHAAYLQMTSYPSPPYSCYEDTVMPPQHGCWGSPSPSIIDLNTQSIVPPHAIQPCLDANPMFETGQIPSLPSSSPPQETPSPEPPRRRKSASTVARTRPQKQTRPKSKTTRPTRSTLKSKPTPSRKKKSKSERVFICSFSRYGCPSTFASKNEWKRHVTSKHIQLGFYRCDVSRCKPEHLESGKTRVRNYFNRKDLFTQHQRRMHAPWVDRQQKHAGSDKEQTAFEHSLEDIRIRCWHEQRKPPPQSACGFCGQLFAGPKSWDQRMEHVGHHFETSDLPVEAEGEDFALRDWAINEGIVRAETGTGQVKLTAQYL
ncbi:hypothetical protein FE257_005133 [Aspergillus nanangensis]|uniref:C2H2 finger domain protein n=1 Tax=Aspergillus nanangensis TaxID=2582783 RepID=A0AAD4CAE8_ASPNN|nr:hypothetical protein FE257_005133 [Aspergillus nanangensis]